MRFIENPDLREWVKNNLRRVVFQKAHELAVQTGCEVLVKLQDSNDYSSQYYATQTLQLQYQGKGLCRQPWDIKVSGLTGLPEAILVERGCQIGGKGCAEEADSRMNEETNAAELSMQDQELNQGRLFGRGSGFLSADGDSQMGCEERVDDNAGELVTSQAASCSLTQPDSDSKGNVFEEGTKSIPGGNGTGDSCASFENQTDTYLGFQDNDAAVTTGADLFRTAATYSIGFPINKFQAHTKSMNARTIFPGQVLEPENPAPAMMQNTGGADEADKPVLKPYQCGICRKTFGSIQILSRHGQVNHGLDKRMSFSCDVCGQSYKIAKHLQRHMRMHHSVMPYICPICNKGFFNGTSLTKHVKIHEQPGEGNQYLAVKGSRASSQDLSPLERSTSKAQLESTPEGQLTEDVADKAPGEAVELGDYPTNIPSLSGLSRMKPIFPQNVRTRGEDQPDSKHLSSSEEQNQDREGHSHHMSWQEASLVSDDPNCNTSTSSAVTTQGGMQQITYIRNLELFSKGHLCHMCGKSYKYSSTFKEHLLTHSSVPRFTCKICGEPFTRQRQFRDHMIHHTGTYPYHCVVCGKGFIRPSIMKKHQCVEQF